MTSRRVFTRSPADVRAANRLWNLRRAAGLSREEFIRRCQADPVAPIPPRTIHWLSAIEKAQNRFPWHYVDTFARALGCSPDELVPRETSARHAT